MAESTAISWTDATWNPWSGCTKVSPGCDPCYMFALKRRFGKDPEIVVRASDDTFNSPLKWRSPRFVFTCSMSDWFHVDADGWRDEAWDIIRRTPQHTYQILTKRHGRIQRCLPADWGDGYPNVWLGVSVETQDYVNRVRHLVTIPAAKRFISAEPLLGPLTLDLRGIDWVIVGGVSGPHHSQSPMQEDHLRGVVDQCRAAGVPPWVKQDSGRLPGQRGRIPDELWVQERPALRS